VFNFLDNAAIGAFLAVLRPHLKTDTMAHAFSVHNLKTPQAVTSTVSANKILSVAEPADNPARLCSHSQMELKELLDCFRLERSVLLPDSRLELLLQAKL